MQVHAMKHKLVWIGMVMMLSVMSVLAGAAEVTFPVPAYTQEELAKVRQWEKAWTGKKIDKTNIDQVAQFMLESYVGLYKNPEKWGAPPEGLYFYVVPYAQIIETTGMIEATRKYAPLVKTDAEGKIINYTEIAGFPFPSPKTGLELAYNTECQTRGDTNDTRWTGAVIDPKSRTDRLADQEFTEMFFIHRVDVDQNRSFPKIPRAMPRGSFCMSICRPRITTPVSSS